MSITLRSLGNLWNHYITPLFPIFILTYSLWPSMPFEAFQLIKLIVYCIVFYALAKNFKKFLHFLFCEPLIVALTGLACFSIVWSATPGNTLDASRNLVVLYFSSIYLAMTFSLRQQMNYLALVLGFATILSIFFAIAVPSYGFRTGGSGPPTWVGIFRHKNRLANAMVMSILVFINVGIRDKKIRHLAFLFPFISAVPLILSQGKGAIIALSLTLAFFSIYWLMLKRDYTTQVVVFTTFLYSFIVVSLAAYFGLEYLVVEVLEKDFTLTGRTEMWDYLLGRALSRPLLGFGYGGFWQNPQEALGVFMNQPWFTSALEGSGNAHNGYIELLLQLGLAGVVLMALSLALSFYRVSFLFLKTKKVEYFWSLQYLILIVIFNISETNEVWLGTLSIGWLFYVSISITSIMEMRKLKASKFISDNPYLRLNYEKNSTFPGIN